MPCFLEDFDFGDCYVKITYNEENGLASWKRLKVDYNITGLINKGRVSGTEGRIGGLDRRVG